MFGHFPRPQDAIVQTFWPNSASNAAPYSWQVWRKPLGTSFVGIFAVGCGGRGAAGEVGGAGAAAGGGGGGSGSQITMIVPTTFLGIEILYVSVSQSIPTNIFDTYVSLAPDGIPETRLLVAGHGANGGLAGGPGGGAALINTRAFGAAFVMQNLAGHSGQNGSSSTPTPLAIPVLGLWIMGGSGGGGLGAAGAAGGSGGAIAGAGIISGLPGGVGGTGGGANPGGDGQPGNRPLGKIPYYLGGTGGGASGLGSGPTVGAAGGNGGHGAPGCGGGGGGAGFTGATPSSGGLGGPGFVTFAAW